MLKHSLNGVPLLWLKNSPQKHAYRHSYPLKIVLSPRNSRVPFDGSDFKR